MSTPDHVLPIDAILPDLLQVLQKQGQAVLQAPPGAGKTTRVPLALLDSKQITGKIIMLEPRRLAARNAAHRLAETLGEQVGGRVGYRMRGDSKIGPNCCIEVVTEGILARLIQSDPELRDYGCVIFDEFHERSIHADFALALVLDMRGALRDDLAVIVMSATLDADPIAAVMNDAPIITAQGRSFPVTAHFLAKPWRIPNGGLRGFESAMAAQIASATRDHKGSILAFLPGAREIHRVQDLLQKQGVDGQIYPLYGALPYAQQRRAIAPSKTRKIVLATSIAETSLTIDGIEVVIDGGLARRARFDPHGGMTRLVTERVTKAESIQRAGRAGRLGPGVVYKLWTKGENGGLRAHPVPEIHDTDLVPMVLAMADWGARNIDDLPFLSAPRRGDFSAAQQVLHLLGALDGNGAITPSGRALARRPTHPRLARLLAHAGADGPNLVALIEGRDILDHTAPVDFMLRWAVMQTPAASQARSSHKINQTALDLAQQRAKSLSAGDDCDLSIAQCLAIAYPDRIGVRRSGEAARYLLSNGRGAVIPQNDPLSQSKYIVAIDLDGDQRDATVRQCLPITMAELRAIFADRFEQVQVCAWDKQHQAVRTEKQTRLGMAALDTQPWTDCPPKDKINAICDGIRQLGLSALPWGKSSKRLLARIRAAQDPNLPDCSDRALLDRLEDWLGPYLDGINSKSDFSRIALDQAVHGMLDFAQMQQLDRLAPAAFIAPTGTKLPIDYNEQQPKIAVRLQELFGLRVHPTIGPHKQPILIALLSPAQRPVQLTSDIVGFWSNSYEAVRKDMRGRYPKHHWPDDPINAAPTRRVKKPR